MADMLYILFLKRLYKLCKKSPKGRIDIRKLVTDRMSYDRCFTFMLWANTDNICTISVMYDYTIINLSPEILKMRSQDYEEYITKKFKLKNDRRKTT